MGLSAPATAARKVRDGGEPLVMVTAYDAPGARIGSEAGAGGRIDEAAIGRDVVERDQRDGADVGSSDAGIKCVEIDFSVVIVGNDLDLDAEPPGELEVGEETRAALSFGREDAVTRVRRLGW